MALGIVILAAGQGTRMKSRLPKVMHPLAGKSLLAHVLDTARALQPANITVVYGHGGSMVRSAFPEQDLNWVEQPQQLGTGHAVLQALPLLSFVDQVLVLYGDVPLMSAQSLQRFIEQTSSSLGLMSVKLDDPSGYGRIVRDASGKVLRIVEHKDALPQELEIDEVNTGIMLIERQRLESWLAALTCKNAQGEYYLTDIITMAVEQGIAVHTSQPFDPLEAQGINDRVQLAAMERVVQNRRAQELMRSGVSLADPARFDLRGTVETGIDVYLDVNVILEGTVTLGNEVHVGANTVLRNVEVADGVTILENCVIENAYIGPGSRIGPFARIRPGTHIEAEAHVGNFVEIKNSSIATGSKINHLSYIGDTNMGSGVNIGAGTITCNYDGANKHRTEIGDRAFIGSNTALIAPIRVGAGATVGAGSVLSKDAPGEQLTLSRSKQVTVDGWKRPIKE